MWQIQIGTPHGRNPICSAVTYRELGGGYSISRNSESYWVSESMFDVGLRIFRGTDEYERLHKMIHDDTVSVERIVDWINRLVIRKTSPRDIIAHIDAKVKQAHHEGRREAKKEIREMLMSD